MRCRARFRRRYSLIVSKMSLCYASMRPFSMAKACVGAPPPAALICPCALIRHLLRRAYLPRFVLPTAICRAIALYDTPLYMSSPDHDDAIQPLPAAIMQRAMKAAAFHYAGAIKFHVAEARAP